MIRINLLPVRQARKREYGKQQLLLGLVILVALVAVLFVIYSRQNEELQRHEADVREAQEQVERLEERSQELLELQRQRTALRDVSDVLAELEANRAGPVQVLDELKRMLNPPVDDLERIAQGELGWNTEWDATRLWIRSFRESDGSLDLEGTALSNDDIAEFHTRLLQSPYFTNVSFRGVTATNDSELGRVFQFSMSARVNYGLGDDTQG